MTTSPSPGPPFVRTWLIWTAGFLAFPIAGLAGSGVAGRVDSPVAALVGGAVAGLGIGLGQTLASRGRAAGPGARRAVRHRTGAERSRRRPRRPGWRRRR